ncbi:MAG: HAD family phosphatase [Nanoarchaeota archaeon]|nr:HAD family phosphatase [Nanoarchaeota archaeon]
MKKRKSKIKAIIFDIGGVLELSNTELVKTPGKHSQFWNKGVHNYVAKKLGISLDRYFDSIDAPYTESMEGKVSEEKATKTLAQNLQLSVKKLKRLYFNAYAGNFNTNMGLYHKAWKLKKQGYKIAILSDQWNLSKPALAPKRTMKKFDVVMISCEVGLRKPNPEIYKRTLRQLKVHAKEVIFIDNQEWNLKPAKKLGMKTILFKNNKQTIEELDGMLD